MITDTSAYNYLSAAFWNIYKVKEDAEQLQGNPPDMRYGLKWNDKFTDIDHARFAPLDFQDYYICQDVHTAFFHVGRLAYTSFIETSYCTPKLQYEPQVQNYSDNVYYNLYPFDGSYVDYYANRFVYQNWNYHTNYNVSWLSGDDAQIRGILSTVSSETITPIVSVGWQPVAYYDGVEAYVYATLSDYTLSGEQLFFKALSVDSHDICAYYNLHGPCLTQALSAALLEQPRKILTFGNMYSNCYLPEQAQISTVNHRYVTEKKYLAYWLNTNEEWCCNHLIQQSDLTSQPSDEKRDPAHEIRPNQAIYWSAGRVPNTSPTMMKQYCSYKAAFGIPKDYPDSKTYRLIIQDPTFCYYGDLSADVYLLYYTHWYPDGYYYWAKKLTLEFERSPFYANIIPYLSRYVLQSKRTFTYEELFCMWPPFDEDAAKTTLNSLRSTLGLSAWEFPTEPYPRSESSEHFNPTVNVYALQPFVFWHFSHPLIEPDGYHFANQDEPSSE